MVGRLDLDVKRLVRARTMATVDSVALLFQHINRNLKTAEGILAIVGLFYASKLGLALTCRIFEGFKTYVYARLRKQDLKSYGKWAVITGGTDGIGKAYARELARRKINIIIISRNIDKLKKTAAEIEKEFQVETFVIQADFSQGREIYAEIKEKLEDKEIGILINNVGTIYDYPCRFMEVPEQKVWDLINLNIVSVAAMTYIIIPQMVKRKSGVIVNVSSISSFYPLPLMAVYSASKAFVDWFSRALEYEYKDQGIVVQSLIPSYIATKLLSFSTLLQRKNFITPDPERFVRSALPTVGVSNRTTGFWSHGLQYYAFEHTPERMWYFMSWWMHKFVDNHKSQEAELKKE